MSNKRFKVIACNVLWREISYYAAMSRNAFSLQFLDWGLHSNPDQLRKGLQAAVDSTPDGFDAILLGYGLCSKGVEDITARKTRLVIPRGHDCITCFLGSKERYREYFDAHPGAYWYTPGWIENHPAPGQERYENTYRQYLEKYGEDNAQYLMEMEQDWFRKYTTAAYVDLGVGNTAEHEEYTRQCAAWLHWQFERLQGDAGMIVRLLNGDWNDSDFLIVEPGHMIKASNNDDIVKSVPVEQDRVSADGLRGVIFDIDGVLCDSEPFIREAAMRMLKERYGLEVKPEDFMPFVGAGEDRFIGGVAEKYGVRISLPEDKVRTYEMYLDIIKGRMPPLPGVHEFVRECRNRGMKIAVASAADRMKAEGNLREIGVPAETFDAVVTGSDVTRHKPDPECYLKAAAAIGLPASSCVVVEDAENGVRAAKAAGARCLALTTSFSAEKLLAAGADWVASDLAQALTSKPSLF